MLTGKAPNQIEIAQKLYAVDNSCDTGVWPFSLQRSVSLIPL